MRVNYIFDNTIIAASDIDLIPPVGMEIELTGRIEKTLKVSKVYLALITPRSHISSTFTCLKVELEECQ